MFVLNEQSLGYDEVKKDHRFLENVVFSDLKEQMFDCDRHWIMRTKFLEARFRQMDRIVENPFEEAMSEHFVRVWSAVGKAVEDQKAKSVLCKDENVKKQNKDSRNNTDEKITDDEIVEVKSFSKIEPDYDVSEVKVENYSHSEVEVLTEGLYNIEIENEGVVDEKLRRESLKEELNIQSQADSETVDSSSGPSLGHNTSENKQARSLSRLERLRRRIRALFSCFGNKSHP